MRPVPLDDLERARGEREQRVGQAEEQRAQPREREAGALRSVIGQRDRDAGRAGKLAQVVPLAAKPGGLDGRQRGDRRGVVVARHGDPAVAECESERGARQLGRQRVRRMEALGCVHLR